MTAYDRWYQLIKALDRDYDELREIMEHGISIKTSIKKNNRGWLLFIEEDWSNSSIELEYYDSDNGLDQRCSWAATQLETWPNVNRCGWQDWQFKYKRDVEKFMTLYNLTWS